MLKKNNLFFKSLEKFKTKNAIITENGKYISYQELLINSEKISKKLKPKKKLVFLLGQNNLETITGYISFINKGYTVALIDFRINEIFFKKLIKLYKPDYIFSKKNDFKIKNLYQTILKYKSYILLKRKKEFKKILHKDLMLLMSTSGSTGSPKFVRQSYLNVNSNTQKIIQYLNIKSKDVTITSLPFTYVYGLSVINTHLFVGATIVLTNRSMIEKIFWEIVKNYKVNNFSGVPYNYTIIDKILKKGLPNSLKYTTQAGGKMNHVLIKSVLNTYKKHKIKLIQMYGAAEATSRMSYLKWKDVHKKIGSIGKPIPGGNFHLINKAGQKINKRNKKGELVYKGKNVFMGYAEKLKDLSLPNLNEGILKTGDIAYVDQEGFYFIEGRKNRYAKIYGVRVNLAELESILSDKGVDTIMREGNENKIFIYFKNLSKANKNIKYLAKITSINQNVFVVKKISKNNLTNNYKFKI
jgi:acyl-coenzyme A synthetase/AMP-(fatty) acid ligase